MLKRSLLKKLCGLGLLLSIIIVSNLGFNYLESKKALENASFKASRIDKNIASNIIKMPIRDKKSGENLSQCLNMLSYFKEESNINPSALNHYIDYLCKEYKNKTLNYMLWLNSDKTDKHGNKHIMTTEAHNVDLTEKLNLDMS